MYSIGVDMGTSTVKIVLIDDKKRIIGRYIDKHYGKILDCVVSGLKSIMKKSGIKEYSRVYITVTGSNSHMLTKVCPDVRQFDDIPAIVDGVKELVSNAGSIIEIGSQGARYITDIGNVPRFSVNEHCAGGTGSFFEDQMSRLGLDIDDYSKLVMQAREIPTLSGRCAVFAKTDIIHRQQEGVSKQDILLGLCYVMIKNYKAVIVKNLSVTKPIVFCGGVTQNTGVIRAIKDVFGLSDDELIIPEECRYEAAYGAALSGISSAGTLLDRLPPADIYIHNEENDDEDYGIRIADILSAINNPAIHSSYESELLRLTISDNLVLKDPESSHIMPKDGCYIGIDIGSTSTDIVLIGEDGTIIDFLYLRTAGDPEGVVRSGLKMMGERYGEFAVLGVGITGSGRERLGRMMGADAIRDEITAQAKAAAIYVPDADTVFEIGGQDSKYISISNGEVVDFTMNKICAAGTGSLIEEQSLRMGIPIEEFGHIALAGEHPCDLGERCTVFIETAIASAEGSGAMREDIAAGLCYSIVRNYLHKVVAGKSVGNSIVLQGGVNYNPGIVAAFMNTYGDRIKVSPIFSISGAVGAAYLAKDVMKTKALSAAKSSFLGIDFPRNEINEKASSEQIRANKAFYRKAGQFAVEGYDAAIVPGRKTIGIPLSLIMFKFFLLAYEFFKNLGYNVVLSDTSNEKTIADSQEAARGETCYPVKLLYGHMKNLADKKVDYIFMPLVHTIRHPHAHAVHNYACPYMQTAAKSIYDTLGLKAQGIELLSPVFDLDLGAKNMAIAMLSVGKQLGYSKPRCMAGLLKGAAAVNRYSENCEKIGKEVLDNLKPDEKVPVIITRNYGISDPVLNMGIPEILLSKGYKVLTLGHLPGMSLDISKDYPNMYWPFGDHLLSGAKLIRNHPNLYAVYLTNHGCGPDSVINHMFAEEMKGKPYLHIEVDEHFSKVGVITRIEAFLNSISNQPDAVIPDNYDIICNVKYKPANITYKPDRNKRLVLPDIGYYSECLKIYYQCIGVDVSIAPAFDKEILNIGRSYMNAKEYLPLPMLIGSIMKELSIDHNDNTMNVVKCDYKSDDKCDDRCDNKCDDKCDNKYYDKKRDANYDNKYDFRYDRLEYMIPYNYGSDADGQYARVIRTILDETGYEHVGIVAPVLEEVVEKADDIELLFACLLIGDIIYSIPSRQRETFMKKYINYEYLGKMLKDAKTTKLLSTDSVNDSNSSEYINKATDTIMDAVMNIAEKARECIDKNIDNKGNIVSSVKSQVSIATKQAASVAARSSITSEYASSKARSIRLVAVGSPLCITSLDEGILDRLDNEGYRIGRVPLSEEILFMWIDNNKGDNKIINKLKNMIGKTAEVFKENSMYSDDLDELISIAEDNLKGFQGANGRYRYAKTIQISRDCDAILELSPRYENTAMVLDMRGLYKKAHCPVYNLSLDGDQDETSDLRLNSFLYYVTIQKYV